MSFFDFVIANSEQEFNVGGGPEGCTSFGPFEGDRRSAGVIGTGRVQDDTSLSVAIVVDDRLIPSGISEQRSGWFWFASVDAPI